MTARRVTTPPSSNSWAWMRSADIVGEGGAAITQTDPDADIFYTPMIWKWGTGLQGNLDSWGPRDPSGIQFTPSILSNFLFVYAPESC